MTIIKRISIPGKTRVEDPIDLEKIFPRNASTSDSSSGDMSTQTIRNLTLGGALREFINNNAQAKHAQISAVAAGEANIGLAKAFCLFLQRLDFDAVVWVGVGFLKKFIKPCPQLIEQIKEIGEAKAAYNLQHAVVKVNSVILDLTFLRLGEAYEPNNSFSLMQFNKYWRETTSVAHLMAITPDQAKQLARNTDSGFTVPKGMRRPGQRAFASAERPMPISWHVFTAKQPLKFLSNDGKTVTIKKGDYYSSYSKSEHHVTVATAADPFTNIVLSNNVADQLLAHSRALQGAPAVALKPPSEITIKLSDPSVIAAVEEQWEVE